MIKLALAAISVIALMAVYIPLLSTKHVEGNRSVVIKKAVTVKPIVSGKPVSISIPTLGIELPVVDGAYDPASRTWSLGKKTAQYAANTPLANDTAGNTFIYGHNNKYVFGSLLNIQPGDEIILTTAEGVRFYYKYRTSFDVKPHEVDSIKHQGAPMLTVQTCVGQYFEHRRMFQFDFVSSET